MKTESECRTAGWLTVSYDQNELDMLDTVNAALDEHGLTLVYCDDKCDGFIAFRIEKKV